MKESFINLRKAAAISVAPLLLAGCTGDVQQIPSAASRAATATAPSHEQHAKIPPDINKYYPNLENRPFTSGTITVAKGPPVTYYNFTDMTFDPEAAKKIYNFYLKTKLPLDIAPNGKKTNVFVEPRIDAYPTDPPIRRILFFIPQNTPTSSVESAGTSFITANQATVTYVKEVNPPISGLSVPEFAHLAFAVEACNQTLVATVNTIKGENNRDYEDYICNSFGALVYAKSKNLTFEQYKAFMGRIAFRSSDGNVPLVVFSSEIYQKASITGQVFK